jgi:hypothetical protein
MKNRPNPVHILSLGAGVQSTTLALMALHGEITPKPIKAVFADTRAEAAAVYSHLQWLETVVDFPIERISAGDLAQDSLKIIEPLTGGKTYVRLGIPAFYEEAGKQVMMQRRCTGHYKVAPIRRAVRPYFKSGVIQWIGISTDEATRMRDSDVAYVQNRYPLIEMRMSRDDCFAWLRGKGYAIPEKSSCVFCPYHSDHAWQRLKEVFPADFARAVEYERQVQALSKQVTSKVITPFLHRTKVPLDQVDFSKGRGRNLFQDDCTGMCGN